MSNKTCGNCGNVSSQVFMGFVKSYFCKHLKSQMVDKNEKCNFCPSKWVEKKGN